MAWDDRWRKQTQQRKNKEILRLQKENKPNGRQIGNIQKERKIEWNISPKIYVSYFMLLRRSRKI
jgi:hypothetical protein